MPVTETMGEVGLRFNRIQDNNYRKNRWAKGRENGLLGGAVTASGNPRRQISFPGKSMEKRRENIFAYDRLQAPGDCPSSFFTFSFLPRLQSMPSF
jgi:hypothetical protein